jgi:predicted nucleotidyltransferase
MQCEEALRILREHAGELKQTFGISTLALFGSVARGEAGAESDVDVLVEFIGEPTFSGYMDLKLRLETIFGRRVDLVTRSGLRPRARPYVEQDLVHVA